MHAPLLLGGLSANWIIFEVEMNTTLHSQWPHHRSNLHNPQIWHIPKDNPSSQSSPSITYVPTSAGATGPAQLSQFFTLHPHHHHPLNNVNLTRFNNQFESVSLTVGDRAVVEEIVVSVLHQEQWDYMLPGVPPTNHTFTLPIVPITHCDCISIF